MRDDRLMRRRHEVWFLRLGLSDGSGAWWFRYLLMNLGRTDGGGCPGNPRGPVQVWATWFPRGAEPQGFVQGYRQEQLLLSEPTASPVRFEMAGNRIGEDSCAGQLAGDGHTIAWDLRYRSTAAFTLSDKDWIGFSRTPHSDATFAGEITFDGNRGTLRWTLHCSRREDATTLVAILDGSGPSAHRLPYLKTNCSGSFEVANNSLSAAKLYFRRPGHR